MVKIINKHIYSTKTATFIGDYSNNLDENDEQYIYESLYLRREGGFFLYCKGGAKTMYSQKINNKRVAGEDIDMLSFDEAQEWGKSHLSTDAYDRFFNLDKETKTSKSDRQTFTVRLPEEYIRKLKIAKSKTNLKYPELFTRMIDTFMKSI